MIKKAFLIFIGLALLVLVYGAMMLVANDNGLLGAMLIGETKTAVRSLVSLLGVFIVLRFLDYLMGFHFKEWLRDAPDHVKGNYFAYRFLGVCLLFGLFAAGSI
tara:strand:- start:1401 stop:1712 length:312 start_codon:yes stop_codon:yes gene_type:complete